MQVNVLELLLGFVLAVFIGGILGASMTADYIASNISYKEKVECNNKKGVLVNHKCFKVKEI